MLVPGYPEGVDPIEVITDLRRVKTSPNVRTQVLYLAEIYKQRELSLHESGWLRKVAQRYKKKIVELHNALDMARITDAKQRMGYREYEKAQREAKAATRRNRLRRLKDAQVALRASEEEEKDFGI